MISLHIACGLSTSILLSTDENRQITLSSYLLLLDIAVLVLVALHPCSRLFFAAFVDTAAFFAGRWFNFYYESLSGCSTLFLGYFFLFFAFTPRPVQPNTKDAAHSSAWSGQ